MKRQADTLKLNTENIPYTDSFKFNLAAHRKVLSQKEAQQATRRTNKP